MRNFACLVIALGLTTAATIRAAEYDIVEDQSNIQFSVPLLAVSKISGKFMKYEIRLDAGKKPDYSTARAEAVIEIASVDTGNDSWDQKLRTPAFFDAAKYPKIQFKSRSVRKVGDKWEATGTLALHGVTREIVLPFVFQGHFDGPHPDEHVGIHATFKFDRRDYGMGWAGNAEAKAVGNIVTVEITVLAKRTSRK